MGIGSFLSKVGSFAPQIAPRKPITPPFVQPEDPYLSDLPVNARSFMDKKPPASAASEIGASSFRTPQPPVSSGSSQSYDTPLSPSEETNFQAWKQRYAPNDSGADYDLRGAFKSGLTPDPKSGHWPDTFKKPNHPTFSNQSKYAASAPDKAGRWDGETYIPPQSADSRTGSAATYRPDLDPDTQKYLDAARQPAPEHPTHGRARGIGEALTSAFIGQPISEQIWDPGYARERSAYERNIANAALPAKIRSQAEKQTADTSHTMAAGALQSKQAENYDANQVLDAVKQGADPGTAPITVGGRQLRFPEKQTVAGNIQGYKDAGYSQDQAMVLAAGGKPSDFAKPQSVKSLEELAARIVSSDDPPEKKQAGLEEIRKAHNILNPEKPVIHWAEGKDGTVTAVTTTPAEVAKGGGKQSFGQIGKPQQARESAGGGDDALVNAVIANPAIFDNLTPTAKTRISPRLQSAGFENFGRPLSEGAMTKMAESTSAVESLKDLRKVLSENEQYVGPVAGFAALNPYSDARKAQAKIDLVKQRVGKALEGGVLRKEDEEKYKRILATLNDTPETAIAKVDGLIATIERDAEIFRSQQRAGGRRVPGGAAAPKAADPLGIR